MSHDHPEGDMASEIWIQKTQNENNHLRELKGQIPTVQPATAAEIGCVNQKVPPPPPCKQSPNVPPPPRARRKPYFRILQI
jgi:hypothetical protein